MLKTDVPFAVFITRKPWRTRKVSVHVYYTYRLPSLSRRAEPDPRFGIAFLPAISDGYDDHWFRKPWSAGWSIFR